MNEVGLAFAIFNMRAVGCEKCCVPAFMYVIFVPHPGKYCVMPIRRAAATPTQEKPTSAAAEKGEAGVVLNVNGHPVNAPSSRTHTHRLSLSLCFRCPSHH